MPQSHEIQLEVLERELKKENNEIVRDAIQAQIDTLQRRLTAKKGRKATTNDGVEVGVGDTVYDYSTPRIGTPSRYSVETIYPGQINSRKVFAVGATGTEIAISDKSSSYSGGGRYSYNPSTAYYSTQAAAHAGLIAEVERRVAYQKGKLDEAIAELERAQRTVEIAKLPDFGKALAAEQREQQLQKHSA